MAAYSLIVGTVDGERKLIASGDPREMNHQFKQLDKSSLKFDEVELISTRSGRVKKIRSTKEKSKAKTEPTGQLTKDQIKQKLDEAGIEYDGRLGKAALLELLG